MSVSVYVCVHTPVYMRRVVLKVIQVTSNGVFFRGVEWSGSLKELSLYILFHCCEFLRKNRV